MEFETDRRRAVQVHDTTKRGADRRNSTTSNWRSNYDGYDSRFAIESSLVLLDSSSVQNDFDSHDLTARSRRFGHDLPTNGRARHIEIESGKNEAD